MSALRGLTSSPTAPPSVPAGQMYLQKAGIFITPAYIRGNAITNTARITYFR